MASNAVCRDETLTKAGVNSLTVRPRSKAALIARLRSGPLDKAEYHDVAGSSHSLKVRIHNLREEGFRIETIGSTYHLTDAPAVCCSHCGSAL